ncbi:MAG: radical SAM protein, partial [Proteobacteria bacterium]|nr:radical SAM protein [Pseudomonadota bacterium]
FDEKDFERVGVFIENNPIYFSGFTILTPFPGTEQWDILKNKIVIQDLDYYNLTNAVIKTRLPEKEFYRRVSELYKTGTKARETFLERYQPHPN